MTPVKSNTMRSVLLFLCFGFVLFGCENEPAIDSLFEVYQGDVPGAAVAVIKDGTVVFEGYYGLADLESQTPISAASNFRLASVTKQFTATAVMMLIDEDLVELETPIRQVFPALPAFAEPITIEHLLRHTSGLMDYESLIPDSVTVQVRDSDVLSMLETSDSLYFEPGTSYSYSNSGYAVLAMLVEKLSGQSFPAFLKARIFEPLGMDATLAFVEGGPAAPNRAFGYSVFEDSIAFTDQSLTSAVLGDGGIYSSITDLRKWDASLTAGGLVSAELLAQAYTPGLENYGFGWRIEEVDGHLRHSHTGSTSGFRNIIQRFPDDDLTVIILTNRNGPVVEPLANEVAQRFL